MPTKIRKKREQRRLAKLSNVDGSQNQEILPNDTTLNEKELAEIQHENELARAKDEKKKPGTQSTVPVGPSNSVPGSVVRTTMQASIPTAQNINTACSGQMKAQLTPGQNCQLGNVQKCENFFSTMIKLASEQHPDTVNAVRNLIQGVVDGNIEDFISLLHELKSPQLPDIIPFLKNSLPSLREALLQNEMSIEGIRPPPDTLATAMNPCDTIPIASDVQQNICTGNDPVAIGVPSSQQFETIKSIGVIKIEPISDDSNVFSYQSSGSLSSIKSEYHSHMDLEIGADFMSEDSIKSENTSQGDSNMSVEGSSESLLYFKSENDFHSNSDMNDSSRTKNSDDRIIHDKIATFDDNFNDCIQRNFIEIVPIEDDASFVKVEYPLQLNKEEEKLRHNPAKKFRCHLCNKYYVSNSVLNTHMILHTGVKYYKCYKCEKSFATKGQLKFHLHSHDAVKKFKCHICNKFYGSSGILKTHMKLHLHSRDEVEKFKCHLCNKCYGSSGILKTHMNLHTGVRDYQCYKCEKSFASKSQLKLHLHSHERILNTHMIYDSSVKNYKFRCHLCNRIFSSTDYLKKHFDSHN